MTNSVKIILRNSQIWLNKEEVWILLSIRIVAIKFGSVQCHHLHFSRDEREKKVKG